MKWLLVLTLALAACGDDSRSPAPAADATSTSAPTAPQAVTDAPRLFAADGAFLKPIQNGERVAIANGWIEPHFSPFPPLRRSELDIVVVSAATRASAQADVIVTYEMLEMAHGLMAQRATPGMAVGHHVAPLNLAMQGTWTFRVKVQLEGVTSTAVLVLNGGL